MALYGAQIWGAVFLREAVLFDSPLQRLWSHALRRALGQRSACAHRVLLQEAGARPLQFYWLRACVMFWNGCIESDNSLVRVALLGEITLRAKPGKSATWLSRVAAALSDLNAQGHSFTLVSRERNPLPVPLDSLALAWDQRWDKQWAGIRGDPRQLTEVPARRLLVYKGHFLSAKPSAFERPAYLSEMLPWRAVRSLTQLRLGVAPVRSTCRARGEDTPYCQRVCLRCGAGVDDEHHLLFDCASTAACRRDYPGVLPQVQTVRELVKCADHLLLVKFVHACAERLTQ